MKTKLIKLLDDLEQLDIFPKLKCPFCERGNFNIDNKNQTRFTNVRTEKYYDLVGEPTDLVGEYSYLILCDNLECGEKGIVVGKTDTIEDGYDDGYDYLTGEYLHTGFPTYKSKYRIDYISVPIELIEIPENVGSGLKDCLQSSFTLFWVDHNSCANRLRSFIELLLDFIKVPKKNKLHDRIESLEKDLENPYNLLAEKFMGIKYIGNEATHEYGQVEKRDVVKSFSIIEYCLQKVYSNNEDHIKALSKDLEMKYKPKK